MIIQRSKRGSVLVSIFDAIQSVPAYTHRPSSTISFEARFNRFFTCDLYMSYDREKGGRNIFWIDLGNPGGKVTAEKRLVTIGEELVIGHHAGEIPNAEHLANY
jgi:hypothetical protein